ncbi:MAG: DoxX family protein [Terriglobales bacterium]|jgi:uncharacterized membrane protein
MVVLLVLFGAWVILRGVGVLGVTALGTWHDSVRYALAVMFVFTGVAHFNKMRHDLARMIPSYFPQPMLIVYITGVCESLGAAGMLIPRFRFLAGICLILLLIGMFTANINAALKGVTLGGKPVTALWLRTPMQILFIGLIWWAAHP